MAQINMYKFPKEFMQSWHKVVSHSQPPNLPHTSIKKEHSAVAKGLDSGTRLLGFETWLCHLLPVCDLGQAT